MSDNKQPSTRNSYKAIGMAVGLILGGLVGLATGNLVIFAGGVMVLGLAVGTALDNRVP
jgi:hypothetical protein